MSIEMNILMFVLHFGLTLSDIDPATVSRELPATIHGEFKPRMLDYRNKLKPMRDKMFGELARKVTTWYAPSLSLAYLSGLSVPADITLFAGALAPVVRRLWMTTFSDAPCGARTRPIPCCAGTRRRRVGDLGVPRTAAFSGALVDSSLGPSRSLSRALRLMYVNSRAPAG